MRFLALLNYFLINTAVDTGMEKRNVFKLICFDGFLHGIFQDFGGLYKIEMEGLLFVDSENIVIPWRDGRRDGRVIVPTDLFPKNPFQQRLEQLSNELRDIDRLIIVSDIGSECQAVAVTSAIKLASNLNIVCQAVVVMPYRFESRFRIKRADCFLEEIKNKLDEISVIRRDDVILNFPDDVDIYVVEQAVGDKIVASLRQSGVFG